MTDIRGGPTSGDHVDIMGNHNMLSDVVLVAAGQSLSEEILSDIDRVSDAVGLERHLRL
eukprot:CAMPEP_0169463142 /NCGR_PEP_ID=MMETSP1042-20121227/19940_1 /TAXON_ID=464988 /ORGANISM="Hemiselmis andersenii, Strain CCMP1180" /LENGTH=58 /DNA_ID=CAMNT_0009575835 /DNA_START=134 /DNA_END=310 /DNA_ORIENTATION=+